MRGFLSKKGIEGEVVVTEVSTDEAISSGRRSQAIPTPMGVLQDTCLNDTHKGRDAFFRERIQHTA